MQKTEMGEENAFWTNFQPQNCFPRPDKRAQGSQQDIPGPSVMTHEDPWGPRMEKDKDCDLCSSYVPGPGLSLVGGGRGLIRAPKLNPL